MSPLLRCAGRAALALMGGLATWSAFPGATSTDGWWAAAPVGVSLLVLATHGARARAGFVLGLLYGWAFLVPHLAWSGTYVGLVPWMALATVSALFYAAYGALLPWLDGRLRAWNALVVGGGWVVLEGARSRVPFGGFPWARLAFSQVDAPTVGWAAVGGAPLVSFVVASSGALLAIFVLRVMGRLRQRRHNRPPEAIPSWLPAILAVVAVVAMASGALIPRPTTAQAGTANIAAVQGNTPRAGLDFNAERRAVLDNHVNATQTLAQDVAQGARPAPDLVLWPENSSDIDPYSDPVARQNIEDVTRRIAAPVLIGAVVQGPGRYLSNTGLVVTPERGLLYAREDPHRNYVKRRPAPFAEYVPYRSFFRLFSDKVDLVRRDFLPGQRRGTVVMDGVAVGDVICFEVAFDDLVRDSVTSGAQMLVVQTNNATFGYSDEAVQQLAMSRFRAVETGRTVVQISTVGVSAIIAPDGSAPQRSDLFTTAVLQEQVALRSSQTLSIRWGAIPELLLAALTLIPLGATLSVLIARRRTTRSPQWKAHR